MNGSRFKVLEASAQQEQTDAGQSAPGTISEITKAGVKILGTDGYLLVTALQIPNAKGSVMRYGELKICPHSVSKSARVSTRYQATSRYR